MSLTHTEAIDGVLALFRTAWLATGYDAFYDDTAQDRGTNDDPWARASIQHVDGFTGSLKGPNGTALYWRKAILTVQVFTISASGLQTDYDLAKIVADAFEGKSVAGGLTFRDVRIREIGRDGAFRQTNVIVEFDYEEEK